MPQFCLASSARMSLSASLSLFAAFVFLFAPAHAEDAAVADKPVAFELSGSEVRAIASETLGRTYELYVKLPRGYDDEANKNHLYPVIYLNDAGYCWVTAVGVTSAPFNHGGYEKAILVGLSYAQGENAGDSRTRDLTPFKAKGWRRETGGARAYLTFMKDEVLPFVEANYRADPARRMLAGQSFGGLFGAYALIEEPGLFHDYILTSPSLWQADKAMFALEEEAFKAGRKLTGRVYFATGDTETPAINGRRHDMVGQQIQFAEILRARGYENLEVRDEALDGGTHLTTFPIGLTRGLRWLLPGEDIYSGG